jgi:PTH1 family peptidyl-tRNA hydrolase
MKLSPAAGEGWLIVGLGNPGPRYVYTRHNLGFMVVAGLSEAWGIPLSRHKLEAVYGQGRAAGQSVVLAQPQTYMNLSGGAVAALLRYFHLPGRSLIVVHDDLDVPSGRLKLAWGGGAGGHKGVLSILNALGTAEFYRVKLGIGRPPAGLPAEAFVLKPMEEGEWEEMAGLVARAVAAVKCLVTQGLGVAQNRFHGSGPPESGA